MKTLWDIHWVSDSRPFEDQLFDPSRLATAQLATGTTLECGCASAIDFQHFRKLEKTYSAIDITELFLEEARKRGAPVRHGSILDIPYPDKSFGTAYCRHVLEHLTKVETIRAIGELIRVAKSLVMVAFFLPPGEKERLEDDSNCFHYNTYTDLFIRGELGKFGRVSRLSFDGDKSVLYVADSRL